MKKILVCEDEAAIRDFVVINLTRAGYDVVEADCGEAALKKYEENDGDFDIAILDVMMPGINGFEVCKELRNRNGGIGIIMLSAKTQEMDKVTGLMLGADDYVAKPFSPSELLARVDSLYRRVALAQSRSENNFKEELKSGEFILNLRNRALLKNGKMIELTQVEFQIMLCRRGQNRRRQYPPSENEGRGRALQSQAHHHRLGSGLQMGRGQLISST